MPHRQRLIRVARSAIEAHLYGQTELNPDPMDYPEPLREIRASFVTLTLFGELRGCIGTLEARYPLVVDVAHHAVDSAFEDPRFPPLTEPEYLDIHVEISVLSPPEDLPVADETDLYRKLQPGVDGLILRDGQFKATFLPSVWDQLPEVEEFVRHLKRKAGLSASYWSPTLTFERYTAQKIVETG